MSLGPFFSPKEGFTTAKQKSLLQRQSIGFLYPAKKVFSIQIPVFSIQTTVYYISAQKKLYHGKTKKVFFSARVSVFSIQPKRFSLSKFRFSLSKPRYTIYQLSSNGRTGIFSMVISCKFAQGPGAQFAFFLLPFAS
jgi:hypothetical protein